MTDEIEIGKAAIYHTLQFDNEADRSWAEYSFLAGAFFAESRMNERVKGLVEALEEKIVSIMKVNFAGPSTDERREWTWATATQALDALKAWKEG